LGHRETQRGASDSSPLPPTRAEIEPLGDDQDEGSSSALRRPGRQFLQSALLLLLAEKPRHGYALTNAVGELGLGEMDRPRIYRALAELEQNGMVKVWDETSQAGHTRRVYSVTDCGHQSLRSAVDKVVHERNALDNFLQRYGRMTPKHPSGERARRGTLGTGHLA
jgi:PadR family transcriptional regulator, regulatory protein PadR